jgi:hypothetical protein
MEKNLMLNLVKSVATTETFSSPCPPLSTQPNDATLSPAGGHLVVGFFEDLGDRIGELVTGKALVRSQAEFLARLQNSFKEQLQTPKHTNTVGIDLRAFNLAGNNGDYLRFPEGHIFVANVAYSATQAGLNRGGTVVVAYDGLAQLVADLRYTTARGFIYAAQGSGQNIVLESDRRTFKFSPDGSAWEFNHQQKQWSRYNWSRE